MQLQSRFTRNSRSQENPTDSPSDENDHTERTGVPGDHESGDGTRVTAEHASLSREISELATTLGEIDARAATRLRDLSHAINTPDERSRWNAVDLHQAFNLERLSNEYALRRVGAQKVRLIEFADKVRNVLVLLPVFLTWFAIAQAARDYAAYIDANPDETGQPFLLLWQQGFGGETSLLSPTFATVALLDAAVILVIILLTLYAHGRREDQEDAVANVALEFYAVTDNTLAEAGVLLARDRAAQPSQLAQNVEALTDRFDANSREIVGMMAQERDRLASTTKQREEEFEDFALFARSMRAGAEQSNRTLAELRQLSRSLDDSVERLGSDVATTGRHQATLLSTLQNLEQLTSSAIQSDQAVTHRLADAASAISESADAAVSGVDNATRITDSANQALRGIGELAQRLVDTSDQLSGALTRERSSSDEFASSMAGATRQNREVADTLAGVATDIAESRVAFAELANRSASQVRSLNQILEQQASLGKEISHAARELGTAGSTSIQRNRESREDIARLTQRLEQLTTSLSRAAQQAPTVDALQKAFTAALRSSPEAGRDVVQDERSPRRWSR